MFPPQVKKVSPEKAMFLNKTKKTKNVRSAEEVLCVIIVQLKVQCYVFSICSKYVPNH